ncbi:MAG: 5-formyltetrahydrofolate cyclo-ligase [Deinococcales bacterium]
MPAKDFYLTRTNPKTSARAAYLSIHPLNSPLEKHRFGYIQPSAEAKLVEGEEISLALIPGLAFDKKGTRLGYGKGFYDGLLAKLPYILKVGITCEALLVDSLPKEPHDIAMDYLCTEKTCYPVEW